MKKIVGLQKHTLTEYSSEQLEKIEKRKRTELTNIYKIIFYAHNSANFDNQFLFKSKNLLFERLIDSHGLIVLTMKGGCIEFRDTMRMTGLASRAQLCQDFKLPKEYSKTEFPHLFASIERLNYIAGVPDAKNWPSKTLSEEHVVKEFDFKEVSIHYQKLDVVSLCIIWHKLSKAIDLPSDLRKFDSNSVFLRIVQRKISKILLSNIMIIETKIILCIG